MSVMAKVFFLFLGKKIVMEDLSSLLRSVATDRKYLFLLSPGVSRFIVFNKLLYQIFHIIFHACVKLFRQTCSRSQDRPGRGL